MKTTIKTSKEVKIENDSDIVAEFSIDANNNVANFNVYDISGNTMLNDFNLSDVNPNDWIDDVIKTLTAVQSSFKSNLPKQKKIKK